MKPKSITLYLIGLLLFLSSLAVPAAPMVKTDDSRLHPGIMGECAAFGTPRNPKQPLDPELDKQLNNLIAKLDGFKIKLATPKLASGEINHLIVDASIENLKKLSESRCFMGYFEADPDSTADSTAGAVAFPLEVDHWEMGTEEDEKGVPKNVFHIYFRAPFVFDIYKKYKPEYWRFWDDTKSIRLKIAAFEYIDDQYCPTFPSFGHAIPLIISVKKSCIGAACLFAFAAWLLAGIAIHARARKLLPGEPGRLAWLVHPFTPWCIAGSSGQASLPQLQIFVFSIIIATLLFYQWMRTGILQQMSPELLYLIGIATVGAGAAQLTDNIQRSLDKPVYDYLHHLGWFAAPTRNGHVTARASQFLLTNDRFDIYKFQMLMFSIVIAAYVIVQGASALANLAIPQSLLTLMGISQGVYVGGHAVSAEVRALQDVLRSMQACELEYANGKNLSQPERETLLTRFQDAAQQAAQGFANLFDRDVPAPMLVMRAQLHEAGAGV
jgi:hypothetical protein